jgi:general secretion pathway protein K
MRRANSRRSERGFALLIVLWTLPLVTMIGTQLTAAGRFETRLAGNLRSAARAEAVADGAVREAIFRLSSGAWAADGRARSVRIGGDVAVVRATDQAGRIDPNTSDPALMTALLRQVGVSAARAAALTRALDEWRMESSDLPAITARYHKAGLPYGPTGKPFRSVGEMGLVLGMTPDVLAALAPHVTVFKELDPDPLLADPVVLAALRASGTVTDPSHIGDPATRALFAEIDASAVDSAGGRFTRRAIIRIAAVDRTNPRPWRILTWDSATD